MNITALYEIYKQYPIVETDTRKISKDALFFALKGPSFNGNSFAAAALESGARYAIIDDPAYLSDERCILVEDVLSTLQELARYHRLQLHIPIIAITGSNGKTTTKELLYTVLSRKFKTYATEGNLNNHIGVPLSLLRIGRDAEMAIIEMGANHQQEIAAYCRIALPDYAVITNCGKAHLEGFGGIEGVRKGKGELYDFIRANKGCIFINQDLDYLRKMSAGIDRKISYGSSDARFTGTILDSPVTLNILAQTPDTSIEVHSRLVGNYNFPNLMLAIAAGSYFGVPPNEIKVALEAYAPDNSRSQLAEKGSNRIILDAYNANPTSMRAAIDNFAGLSGKKRLWLGAMKEMGPEEEKEHRDLVAYLDQWQWEQVILVGKEFEAHRRKHAWFADSAAAAEFVAKEKPQHAFILIKGSRGSKMELLFDALD